MSIIERAGQQLGLKAKSLIEKAADRLVQIEPAARPPTSNLPPQEPGLRSAVQPGRKTARQVAIDFDRLRRLGFAMPRDQTPVAEEFRLVKRPLVTAALSNKASTPENRNTIMVTSAKPREGKTFVATNLAFSIASEHDVFVLLIDADLAKPTIPAVLGFEAEAGLIDVVSDSSVSLADALVRTNIENLTILPSGRAKPGSSELLASARMARFVDEISGRYRDRIIIFDSPPVLARSEPIVLAKHVGQIVFVVEAERTSRTAIEEALGLLDRDRIGGVVLNKAPAIATRDRFGQQYGYYGV